MKLRWAEPAKKQVKQTQRGRAQRQPYRALKLWSQHVQGPSALDWSEARVLSGPGDQIGAQMAEMRSRQGDMGRRGRGAGKAHQRQGH